MNLALLVAYVALLVLAYARARSTAWLVITVAGTGGLVGAFVNFFMDRGHEFTRVELQWLLLVTLALVAVLAWVPWFGFGASAPGASADDEVGR